MSVCATSIFRPKILNFRDKYYSSFTKLYYFGIYLKQFKRYVYYVYMYLIPWWYVIITNYEGKYRINKKGQFCSCPHSYPQVFLEPS